MDKAILKKFAIESRQDLMEKIKNKMNTFYIDEEFQSEQKGDLYILSNDKHTLSLTNDEYKKRELLIKRINELGIEQVIEEAAYTWFNRIVAIRYMEINDYLPLTKNNQSLGIRVLSSKDNTLDPEILKFTNLTNPDLDIDFKKEKYAKLKDDNEKFKYVLLLICKKLGRIIPQVFDGITDYIDILIPDNLLNDTGFVNKIVNEVPEDNYNQVEIIGWLYQYYNQTEKDRVISAKKQYKKNEIAYATQLFTPDWIVKYMVENTLGKFWIEHKGNSSLIQNWKYFIKCDNMNYADVIDPKNITCIDPCMGSGHILVYMFEVLYQIYESYGYNKQEIPENILKNNLYGLDIDDRAGQLAVLSVILKARKYDKNIFNKDVVKNLKVISIQEYKLENIISYINTGDELNKKIQYLNDMFDNTKEIGALLNVEKVDYNDLINYITNDNTIFGIELRNKIIPLIKQAEIMSNKYDIIVTNPPYMNNNLMSSALRKYINKNYSNVKGDMFSAFVVKNSLLGKKDSYLGFMTPYVWMFITSYKELREYILNNMNIESLVQLEYSALEEATVPICTFTLKNNTNNMIGRYFRLVDYKGRMRIQEEKFLNILKNNSENYYEKNNCELKMLPESIIAYWISSQMQEVFNNKSLGEIIPVKKGADTGDNKKYLREWYEVNTNDIHFYKKKDEQSIGKWVPYNKGGEFRKWYGNNNIVVNWENDGYELKKSKANLRSQQLYFEDSITWSAITSSNTSFRFSDYGAIFDSAGSSMFGKEKNMYLLGLCNSVVARDILNMINPTLNFGAGSIAKIPIIFKDENKVSRIVEENVKLSKEDWNSFETSWEFIKHPLISTVKDDKNEKDMSGIYLSATFNNWEEMCNDRFNKLKENEEKINEIVIDIYGLKDELEPFINEKNVTVRKAEKVREVKSLISYAVGCMFGRYSLDQDGLVYAGGDFDKSKYKTFSVDEDNIIPITDEAYFGDDIVERFKKFIKVVYGDNTFNENMDFIAETLGKKGTETSEDTIRRYFLNDFFNDHVKIYQKRPIYWLFDSGKKNGFKALIYMHRFNENLIPNVRLDYLHRVQTTYEKLLSDVNYKLTTDLSLSDKKAAKNRQADLNAKLNEIKEYDEKIAHIANQRINIDLDDGVKVNYDKFKDILAKIK